MNFDKLLNATVNAMLDGRDVMLLAAPGVGKTMLARMVPTLLEAETGEKWYFHEIVGPAHDTFSWSGLHVLPPGSLEAIITRPQAYPPAHMKRNVVVFIDEAMNMPDQAAPQAAMTGAPCGGHPLPENTRWIVAGNRPEDGTNSQEPSEAMRNRCRVFTLDPDVDDWIKGWVIPYKSKRGRGFHPLIWAFLKARPKWLSVPRVPGEANSATPRSWTNASDALWSVENESESSFIEVIGSCVGATAAMELAVFRMLAGRVTKLSDVLADPVAAPLPKGEMSNTGVRFSEFDLRYFQTTACGSAATNKTAPTFLTYVKRMGQENVEIFKRVLENRGITDNAAMYEMHGGK